MGKESGRRASAVWLRAPSGRIYVPNEPQTTFLTHPAAHCSFVGGQGAGKSLTLAMWTLLTMLQRPGCRLMLARWGFDELHKTTWDMLLQITPKSCIRRVASSAQQMELEVWGGSKCYGWNLKRWESYASMNLDGAAIDEICELPDAEPYQQVCSRLRGPYGPRHLRGAGTPKGKNWVYQYFVNPGLPDHDWVHAPTSSNLFLPVEYERRLRAIYSPAETKRFLDATFTDFEGKALHNFKEEVHVIDPFLVPAHWPRYRGLDPGFAMDPACCLLATTDEQGNLYFLDEYYQTGDVIREQSKKILRMCRDHPVVWTVYDPSAHRRNDESGKTQVDLYREGGLDPMVRASTNSVQHRVASLLDMLRVDPERLHPITFRKGSPRLFITRGCPNLLRELETLSWDKKGKLTGDDHAFSAAAYLAMASPAAAHPEGASKPNAAWHQFWQGIGREASLPSYAEIMGNERAAA